MPARGAVRIGIGMDIDVHRVITGQDMTLMGPTGLTEAGVARRITQCGMAFAYGSATSANQVVT